MTPLCRRLTGAATFALFAIMTAPAHAAGSNMPWEAPLQSILESIHCLLYTSPSPRD